MFYCDECAREKKYPIMAEEDMKSLGPCEICKKSYSDWIWNIYYFNLRLIYYS